MSAAGTRRDDEAARGALLVTTLQAAVPLWIVEARGWTPEYRTARAAICSQYVAEHGDLILYQSKHPGETAEAFNRLAEGLALLAFVPGGVTAFGQHWEAGEREIP